MTSTSESVLNEVSTVLWRERELLDGLAFRLEMQRLVLVAGDFRWLARACREVEVVLDQLRSAELVRAVRVEILAVALGLGPSPSLRQLAEAAGEPWTEIFLQHRRAFLDATSEAARLAAVNTELLDRGRESTRRALEWINGTWGGPDRTEPW